ncbi:MAG: Transcription initiation factor TFIID subunit 5 [Watsoniomyces obsoletus]|nr:MAG: Transcription initiation factor TFIID subunit 5 [Watsoniomyces obsoletus]
MDLETGGESPWGDVPSRSHPQDAHGQSREGDAPTTPGDDSSTKPAATEATPGSLSVKSPAGRGPRTPRRFGPQTTQLEAVNDPLGPLGPIGDTNNTANTTKNDGPDVGASQGDPRPAPPDKEASGNRSLREQLQPQHQPSTQQISASRSTLDSTELDNDGDLSIRPKIPPPVLSPPPSSPQPPRQTKPSMPIEQAANPKFEIAVGDPHKVGDLTSSHIVYQVRTKTTSKAYKEPEFSVSRRYRDFLWLYNQLHSNNPGVVVPPPPEKQAVGRFDANFVESRRAALERMLNKSAAHPILQHDGDLKLFLESESFNIDIKHKEKKDPALGEGKGMFSSIGLSSSSSGKFIEQDDWFHDRRIYLDALENQLKALLKTIDLVVKQRKELAEAAGDFSSSLHSLSTVELSPALSGSLGSLSDVQLRIREVYERQAQQDVLTLGITVDEYIRLIGSVKQAFQQRQKAFGSWRAAETELQKRKTTQDKTLRQGKTQQDRLNQLSADVNDAERKVHQARLLFEDMGRLLKNELDRFEREKVEDFKSGLETFLESAVEAQKELIELWETYLVQLDADGDVQPFYHAGGAVQLPPPSTSSHDGAGAGSGSGAGHGQGVTETQTQTHAHAEAQSQPEPTEAQVAANVTADQEE